MDKHSEPRTWFGEHRGQSYQGHRALREGGAQQELGGLPSQAPGQYSCEVPQMGAQAGQGAWTTQACLPARGCHIWPESCRCLGTWLWACFDLWVSPSHRPEPGPYSSIPVPERTKVQSPAASLGTGSQGGCSTHRLLSPASGGWEQGSTKHWGLFSEEQRSLGNLSVIGLSKRQFSIRLKQ